MEDKNCVVCNTKFTPLHNRTLTCRIECRKVLDRESQRKGSIKYYYKNREKRILERLNWSKENKERDRETKKIYLRKFSKRPINRKKNLIRQNSINLLKSLGIPRFGKCQKCGKEVEREIHHITYTVTDIELLCKKCHYQNHNRQVRERF